MTSTPLTRAIVTFGYVGYLRPAPGTWGSLAAAVLAVPLISFGSPALLLGCIVLSFALGLWATRRETASGPHDPSEIVVDEVAGQWVALLPIALLFEQRDAGEAYFYGAVAFAFALFRLFDIWKPWPVSWADRRTDAWGVMLDDIVAGILAALSFLVLIYGMQLYAFD
ncbi:MAG: phosphatidylglycerophosphatase A [Pseudomonadota bacterium]